MRRVPLWRVHVEGHAIAPRYVVAELAFTTPAVSERQALELGVEEAHRRAGVPPWGPCRRASLEHATATLDDARSERVTPGSVA